MSNPFFDGVIGHRAIVRILEASVERPAPAYVLVGQPHLGKRLVAEAFIAALVGSSALRSHPDVIFLEPEEGKKQVSVDQVRELRERVSLRPMVAKRVVACIPAADRLNESGTNALLKMLEEPPADAVFVLVAEDVSRLPATVLSRSVVLRFDLVAREEIVEGLRLHDLAPSEAEERARECHGRPGLALEPSEKKDSGALFVEDFLQAKTLGARLTYIEYLSKMVDSQEDATATWRDVLLSAMRATGERLEAHPIEGTMLGLSLVSALRLVGGAVPPRVALEAGAARLVSHATEELSGLFPAHLPRPLPLFYAVIPA